jgi:hypothetical protein
VDILDGGLAQVFGTVFSSFYLNCNVKKSTLTDDGEGGYTQAFTSYPGKVQRDDYSAFYRNQAGIPDTDVKLIVLQANMTVSLEMNDVVEILDADGNVTATYKVVGPVKQDASSAVWEAQGTPIDG